MNQLFTKPLEEHIPRPVEAMIAQGLMMNFWFSPSTTLESLKRMNFLNESFKLIIDSMENMDRLEDFEIKRFILGFSSLVLKPGSYD